MTQTEAEPRSFAVVTGASSGIGKELARQFAEHNFDVLIAAEDSELATSASELGETGAHIEAVQVDLTTYDGVERLYTAIKASGRPVDAVALNAGVGVVGEFAETDLSRDLEIIDLNVKSTVHLAKLVVKDMKARGSGKILFTSSIASTTPNPYQAVYAASKSFVQSFAEGLRGELKDTDITVTAFMPGPTDTEFFERADAMDTKLGQGPKDDPATVAKQGFEALMDGQQKAVTGGLKTKVQGMAAKVTPDKVKGAMMGKMSEPGSAS
jgi:short-subunit dehydrogenase